MRDEIKRYVNKADEKIKLGKYVDAGRLYEEAAQRSNTVLEKAELWEKAAEMYQKYGMTDEEIRCNRNASEYLLNDDKAGCLLSCWKAYARQIVAFEYDCSFEWRGETDGSHDSYQDSLNRIQGDALDVLVEALSVKDADQRKLCELAEVECRMMEREGGWGAERCWKTLNDAKTKVGTIR